MFIADLVKVLLLFIALIALAWGLVVDTVRGIGGPQLKEPLAFRIIAFCAQCYFFAWIIFKILKGGTV